MQNSKSIKQVLRFRNVNYNLDKVVYLIPISLIVIYAASKVIKQKNKKIFANHQTHIGLIFFFAFETVFISDMIVLF